MCLKYIRVFSNIFLLNTVWKNIGIRWEGTENQLVLKNSVLSTNQFNSQESIQALIDSPLSK